MKTLQEIHDACILQEISLTEGGTEIGDLRLSEFRNIRQIIGLFLIMPEEIEEETITEIRERVVHLIIDPGYAGSHHKFLSCDQPEAPTLAELHYLKKTK